MLDPLNATVAAPAAAVMSPASVAPLARLAPMKAWRPLVMSRAWRPGFAVAETAASPPWRHAKTVALER